MNCIECDIEYPQTPNGLCIPCDQKEFKKRIKTFETRNNLFCKILILLIILTLIYAVPTAIANLNKLLSLIGGKP